MNILFEIYEALLPVCKKTRMAFVVNKSFIELFATKFNEYHMLNPFASSRYIKETYKCILRYFKGGVMFS